MQESEPEPDPQACACGRSVVEAAVTAYRSQRGHWHYHRCQCGAEWTEQQVGIDPYEPITSDELLVVHERLAEFEGPLQEMLGLRG